MNFLPDSGGDCHTGFQGEGNFGCVQGDKTLSELLDRIIFAGRGHGIDQKYVLGATSNSGVKASAYERNSASVSCSDLPVVELGT